MKSKKWIKKLSEKKRQPLNRPLKKLSCRRTEAQIKARKRKVGRKANG